MIAPHEGGVAGITQWIDLDCHGIIEGQLIGLENMMSTSNCACGPIGFQVVVGSLSSATAERSGPRSHAIGRRPRRLSAQA